MTCLQSDLSLQVFFVSSASGFAVVAPHTSQVLCAQIITDLGLQWFAFQILQDAATQRVSKISIRLEVSSHVWPSVSCRDGTGS